MCVILKMAARRAKRTKIWASEISNKVDRGTFDCQVFKVSLKSFGAFPSFDNLVSRNGWPLSKTGQNLGFVYMYIVKCLRLV